MGVLTLVTGIAIGWSLLLVQFAGVAAEARGQAVFPDQRVFRIPVMIERDGLPINFSVTFLALLPESRAVDVVLLMAGVTTGRCFFFVERPLVAAFAFDCLVISL